MVSKAVVLLSGGLDSAVALATIVDKLGHENVSTLSIYYGQKHSKELNCAKKLSEYYGVEHFTLDLTEIFKHSNCSLLVNSTEQIPEGSYENQINREANGKVSTYVPFRNGLMLSTAAAFAQSIYDRYNTILVIAAHKDDAAGHAYADCTEDFLDKMSLAITSGTYNKVKMYSPFASMNKAEIVKTGLKLNVPFELTYSCYNGGESQCGVCGTCIDRINAFKANDAVDPVPYDTKPFEEVSTC